MRGDKVDKTAFGVEGVELSGLVFTVEGERCFSAREPQLWPPAGMSIFNNSSGAEQRGAASGR